MRGVVTHHRLEKDGQGGLRPAPAAQLAEPLIVRPTSETIIGASYAKWVQSWRDLPILINQWANVVRMEMRPRLFLRTAEFLWQEGHTAHETEAEARAETMQMLRVYETFARDWLALPVVTGERASEERAFSRRGADGVHRGDGAGPQGDPGRHVAFSRAEFFSKASGIQFLSRENKQELAWTTSWGVSTRLVGTIIMAHSDDDGLILPPRVAPEQIVISPVSPKPETRDAVYAAVDKLAAELRAQTFMGEPLRVEVDKRDLGGGVKSWEWIKKGVPHPAWSSAPATSRKAPSPSRAATRPRRKREFLPMADFVAQAAGILQDHPGDPARPRHRAARYAHREDRHQGGILRLLHAEE